MSAHNNIMKRLIILLFFLPFIGFTQPNIDYSGGNFTVSTELSSNNSFAGMYNPSTVISTDPTNTYVALSGWTAGHTNEATADVVDSMIIINQAGVYQISFNASFTHSGTAVLVHICPFIRDRAGGWIELVQGESEVTKATGGSYSNVATTLFEDLLAGDTLGIRVKADKTGNFTASHGNMNVIRIK